MKAFAVPPCVVFMLSVRKKTRTEYSEQVLLFYLERMLSHRAVDSKFTVSGDALLPWHGYIIRDRAVH